MRWDLEKVKNRLNQKEAWATSTTAKTMPGDLPVMAQNLMVLVENDLRSREGIFDKQELERRVSCREKEVQKAGRKWAREIW